ncbi:MAG: restriction endonuclease subunit R, partial [Flavobacteriales bacterium]
MKKLNLKKFDLKIKIKDNKRLIFDCIRNSYFHLTKEEWVRQNVIQTLINDYDIPKSKISVEKGFKINSLNKRFDIVVFNS